MWIACQDGSIAICDINTCSITEYRSFNDLVKHGQLLKCMKAIGDEVVVLAYYHGMLAFIKNSTSVLVSEQPSSLLQSIDQLISTDYTSTSLLVTKNLENIGCLNTIEIVDDHQQLVWCSCDKGTIYIVESTVPTWEIFQHYGSSSLKINALMVASVSDKLGAEDNIVQLKSIFDLSLQKTVVYAVHENSEQKSFVISCWLTDQTLQRVVSLNDQGKIEILL